MARNTLLSDALLMLKGELGLSLTAGVATAKDQELYTMIDNVQKFLAMDYDWPFQKVSADVAAAAASRYLVTPTTVAFERPVSVEVLYSTFWQPVGFGIGAREYNVASSGDGGVSVMPYDPILKWDWKPGDDTQFEIWPVPATAQTLRFRGQKVLSTLKTAGSYDTTKTLDLDDLLVILFVAAELAQRSDDQAAQMKVAKAQNRLNKLRASYSSRSGSVILGGGEKRPDKRYVPIVTVHA